MLSGWKLAACSALVLGGELATVAAALPVVGRLARGPVARWTHVANVVVRDAARGLVSGRERDCPLACRRVTRERIARLRVVPEIVTIARGESAPGPSPVSITRLIRIESRREAVSSPRFSWFLSSGVL